MAHFSVAGASCRHWARSVDQSRLGSKVLEGVSLHGLLAVLAVADIRMGGHSVGHHTRCCVWCLHLTSF
jgi:hypothetical protein